MMDSLFSHIKRCAEVPSFNSYEERLHPYIESVVRFIPGAKLEKVDINNLAITIPGKKKDKTVVLTAHLDKIDHWGDIKQTELPFSDLGDAIEGQLDDTVGLGICLAIMERSFTENYPNLVILFSEMEESSGLKNYPERLKNAGKDYLHGQGAEALSRYLIEEMMEPEAIITIDTTPLFKGERGIAIYSAWWELFKLQATAAQLEKTRALVERLKGIQPELKEANNTNDYMIYGRVINRNSLYPVPSIALEPAIFPYHQANERVFKADVIQVYELLHTYLSEL
jgi:acetylornithine deacetylase/succinyl-diaminopimelate desuccinylase-like protein